MSRRRKRKKESKKQNSRADDKVVNENPKPSSPSPATDLAQEKPLPQSPPTQVSELPPAPSSSKEAPKVESTPKKQVPSVIDELEDLSDDFENTPTTLAEDKIALPTASDKKAIRTIRRAEEASRTSEESQEKPGKEHTPQKKQRLHRTSEKLANQTDELGALDDEDEIESRPASTSSSSPEPAPLEKTPKPIEQLPEPKNGKSTQSEPLKNRSAKELAKEALSSLSIVEQVSIGAILLVLVVSAIWASTVVSSRIPSPVITSKLKFPLKGEAVVIASLDTYWRSPMREGENVDQGVPENVKIIPEIKVTLDPNSRAKSLRFLFRDEDGRYAGDSATVTMSGSQFAISDNVTATTKDSSATVHATTGFLHEGDLISYLADESFKWELVILESKDGQTYTEFMAIPISPNRKDNS